MQTLLSACREHEELSDCNVSRPLVESLPDRASWVDIYTLEKGLRGCCSHVAAQADHANSQVEGHIGQSMAVTNKVEIFSDRNIARWRNALEIWRNAQCSLYKAFSSECAS